MSDMLQLVVEILTLNVTEMTQRMSDMLQLVVEILNSQRDRNDSTNVRYTLVCRRRA